MSRITTQDVEYVAQLARLELSDEETSQLTEQLSRILAYIEKLNELDTNDVPPTSHVLPIRNVVRRDEAAASMSREAALAIAPEESEGHYEVPRVIE
ncbi:Asp-tRNA(Asn)/Glu-tRNA(Gln) amidotransferase subunit GatC [Candidatus Poribacteria bacterium]|nr:Asp-tRNA(Asn)/Glu-tRNA(Gln) amidotransferase subunit GatC [Candidatus Poribacteria bacterium]